MEVPKSVEMRKHLYMHAAIRYVTVKTCVTPHNERCLMLPLSAHVSNKKAGCQQAQSA